MLGRLLSTAAATLNPAAYASRNSNQLESVTEEEHTSGLLFPDTSLLHRSKTQAYPLQTSSASPSALSAGAFDDNGSLDLDTTKDFRVIIAQNAIGDRDHPCILLDSRAPLRDGKLSRNPTDRKGPESLRLRGSRPSSIFASEGNRPALGGPRTTISDLSPLSSASDVDSRNSALFQARSRRSTFSTPTSDDDQYQRRISGGVNESGLLNCIFGSNAFSYRGSSTKMHILPSEEDITGNGWSISGFPRHPALRRAETSVPPCTTASESLGGLTGPRSHSPKVITVLVTRMFSVNLPRAQNVSFDHSDISDPTLSNEDELRFSTYSGKSKKIKEKKTPMYAVAITIRFPVASKPGRTKSSQQDGESAPVSMSASLDSHQMWGTTFNDGSASSTNSSLDDRIDILVDHWDVIARTLSNLENLASKAIIDQLQKTVQFAEQLPKPVKGPNMQRTNQTIVQLAPRSLAGNQLLLEQAIRATKRVSIALKTPQVVTGQNRWGVWREEARWIAKSLNEKEHNFFFLVLVTAFLGNHTEWLNLFGPDWYRRRHYVKQRAQLNNELSIHNRTVIISPNKMAARRLIFLLSAFLPPQQRTDINTSLLRPGTPASVYQVSQSPPYATIARQESLRRSINRRARARQFTDDQNMLKRSSSVSSNEISNVTPEEPEFVKGHFFQGRRGSDTRSIRTSSLSISINNAPSSHLKTATTSSSSAIPGAVTPVPHFAPHSQGAPSAIKSNQAAGAGETPASANLLQNLRMSDSNPNMTLDDIQPANKWNGIISGFWGPRQVNNNASEANMEQAVSPISQPHNVTKAMDAVKYKSTNGNTARTGAPSTNTISIPSFNGPGSNPAGPQDVPPYSPVKLSVEANDGVVDVEVPLPGFLSFSSSNDSTLTSPKKARTSVTSMDYEGSFHSNNHDLHSNSYVEHDGSHINVAGWLNEYHEDFVLQAVRPSATLEDSIKRSMSAEATPNLVTMGSGSYFSDSQEKWVDICSTMIADTRTFTIKRIRLRRKIRAVDTQTPLSPQVASPDASLFPPPNISFDEPKNPILTGQQQTEFNVIEEQFIEEPIMDLDGTLVDAIERVLASSSPPSVIHSRAPSPTRSRRARVSMTTAEDNKKDSEGGNFSEIPRNECRRTILGALDEVVRSVMTEYRPQDTDFPTGTTSKTGSSRSWKKFGPIADNTLREGIRGWLRDIDESC